MVEIACIDVNTSTTKYRKVEKWKRMSGMYSVIVFNRVESRDSDNIRDKTQNEDKQNRSYNTEN